MATSLQELETASTRLSRAIKPAFNNGATIVNLVQDGKVGEKFKIGETSKDGEVIGTMTILVENGHQTRIGYVIDATGTFRKHHHATFDLDSVKGDGHFVVLPHQSNPQAAHGKATWQFIIEAYLVAIFQRKNRRKIPA